MSEQAKTPFEQWFETTKSAAVWRHQYAAEEGLDAGNEAGVAAAPFQSRVQPWMMECFGPTISADKQERNHRFLEEALELVQACGATQSEAHQLVDYVYGRPVGEKSQEVGGVQITLAALCLANDLDMHQAGEVELARIWTKVEQMRAKQAAKPKHSPLPAAPADARCKSCGGNDADMPCLPGRRQARMPAGCAAACRSADASIPCRIYL
ncbi:MAG: hypothetical protein JWM30_3847 [Burkholderia sp.]|nr:hypothetical protein [Burkholderia sp.]